MDCLAGVNVRKPAEISAGGGGGGGVGGGAGQKKKKGKLFLIFIK